MNMKKNYFTPECNVIKLSSKLMQSQASQGKGDTRSFEGNTVEDDDSQDKSWY